MMPGPASQSDGRLAPGCMQLSRAKPDPKTKGAAVQTMSERPAHSYIPSGLWNPSCRARISIRATLVPGAGSRVRGPYNSPFRVAADFLFDFRENGTIG